MDHPSPSPSGFRNHLPHRLRVSGSGAAGSRFRNLEELRERIEQPLAASQSPSSFAGPPHSAAPLALEAVQAAWQEAAGAKRLRALTVGVIVGSSRTMGRPSSQANATEHPVQELVYSSPVALAGEIARQLKCTGPCLAVSSACASGVSALALAGDLLVAGSCDAVVVGAVDLATHPETARLFEQNGLCAPAEMTLAAQPFDHQSPGIHLADGAGFLVLERTSSSDSIGEEAVFLTGWAQRSHPQDRCGLKVATTQLAPCLTAALKQANLQAQDLDLVYTHGNGNPRSDARELEALHQFFAPTEAPTISAPLVATKHLTGHCLGATSAIEAALTVHALQRKLTLNPCRIPGQSTPRPPIEAPAHASVHAFGLWGSCAAVVFSQASTRTTAKA